MFLKSLTIKGFKSFADTATLEFEPGVTVVVGPNGSGKSNVVDAVSWVLGAQGPKTVRSAKMEDVIFAGTPKRAALGRAEVSLTIDNSAGLLPIDFSEVTITRTLFRTGESEYAINRVPCRLLDVQELLSDTGVGRQQHTIISQGNLDSILNSRPEERRLVIEEAAGVLKYRRRKERSERRLESTESSLLRLQDLLREVRRQLRPLEKQAESARRHDDLVAELQALRKYLSGRELGAVEARLAAAARTRAALSAEEEQIRRALTGLDTEVLTAEAQESEARQADEDADLAEAVSRAEGLRARADGLIAVIDERRRGLQRQLAVSIDHDVISSLEAEAASLAEQLEQVETEAPDLAAEELEVADLEARLQVLAAEVDERWRRDGPAPTDPAAEVRGELTALQSSLERAQGESRRLESRATQTDHRVTRLVAELDRLQAAATEIAGSIDGLASTLAASAAALTAAETAHSTAEDARRQADAERHRWEARVEALAQALDQARARAGAERLADVAGVVGTLLEVVEIDAGWETAFEAAAGEALAAVVVDGVDSAQRSLDELRRQGAGGAVLALPDPAALSDSAALSDPAARVGAAAVSDPAARVATGLPVGATVLRGHVRSRLPAMSALLDTLLAPAVVVESWTAALDLAIQRPDLVVVTSDGDRCGGGLWRTGAGGAGVTGAALEEARDQADAALARSEAATAEQRSAKTALEVARAAHVQAQRDSDTGAARQRSSAEAARRCGTELADARDEAAAAKQQAAEMASRLVSDQERIVELRGLLPELEAAAAVEAERALAERADRSRLAEQIASAGARRREHDVRAAGVQERRTLVTGRLAQVEERLARNTAERDEAATRRVRLAAELAVIDRLAGLVGDSQARLLGAVERLRAARRAQTDASRRVSERLDGLRKQRAAAERQLSETRERIGRTNLDETESRVRLETLTEAIRRELDCEPEATRDAECPPLAAGTSASTRRSELERELRLMGPINPLALEEFTALQERHTFLEGQLEDVRSARRELSKVIRAIDAEILEVLRAAWADVAEHFEQLFATLFPDGQGRLRLTDPDHLLESGIEIEARPAGKNVRRLTLLSGGERSLVALAFLFAVFRSRPSPFYLMDEVEAALDDVNLHRFLDLVHEFRDEAQLVIVSHQKRTMEAADCLYGVTMAPGGSSRVVSETVESRTAAV